MDNIPDWDWLTEEEKKEYVEATKGKPAHRDALTGPRDVEIPEKSE